MSPDSAGGFVRRAAPEPNKRALYVGGLDPRVTEDVLRQIFETTGHVQNVKIIPDKNVGAVRIKFSFKVELLRRVIVHGRAEIVSNSRSTGPNRTPALFGRNIHHNKKICAPKVA